MVIFLDGLDCIKIAEASALLKDRGYKVFNFVSFLESAINIEYEDLSDFYNSVVEFLMESNSVAGPVLFIGSPYLLHFTKELFNAQITTEIGSPEIDQALELLNSMTESRYFLNTHTLSECAPSAKSVYKNIHPSNLHSIFNTMPPLYQRAGFFIIYGIDQILELKEEAAPQPQKETNKEEKKDRQKDEFKKSPKKEDINKNDVSYKLELAKTIQETLSKRVIKTTGKFSDDLESEVKGFLRERLNVIMGIPSDQEGLSKEEIFILKKLASKLTH